MHCVLIFHIIFSRSKYGDLVAEVETGKKEYRGNELMSMPMVQFMQEYNTSDIYMVQDIWPEMYGESVQYTFHPLPARI